MSFNDAMQILRNLNDFSARKNQAQLRAELMNAILHGRTPTVINLVHYEHAPVNFTTNQCLTPLGLATQYGYFDITKFLLGAGAEVRTPVLPGGTSILHVLAQTAPHPDNVNNMTLSQRVELIKIALNKGADLNALDHKGHTPLLLTVGENNYIMADFLLQCGANANTTGTYNDFTPLHIAALHGNLGMAKLLLLHGADITKTDLHGLTARELLTEYKDVAHVKVYDYLLSLEPEPEPEPIPEPPLESEFTQATQEQSFYHTAELLLTVEKDNAQSSATTTTSPPDFYVLEEEVRETLLSDSNTTVLPEL